MGIATKIDNRSRLTLPIEIREKVGIKPNDEIIIEGRDDEIIITKPISPREFIKEAEDLAKKIKKTKVREIDPLKIKEIWTRDL